MADSLCLCAHKGTADSAHKHTAAKTGHGPHIVIMQSQIIVFIG